MSESSTTRRPDRRRWIRWLCYLLVLLAVAAWKYLPRPWHPTLTIVTPHYEIASTANREQSEEIGRVVEVLYSAYSNRFGALPSFRREHPKLKLLLYKDRDEMRRVNPGLGWAEAFYRKPYCRAYYSAKEVNPHHWMLHEAVHQLNEEVAELNPKQWLEEGLAEYFSTSRIQDGKLQLGHIDPNTYPVWWIDEIATGTSLEADIGNGSVIPLRAIVTGHGGPSMKQEFNRYYLHWWTLTHLVFESPAYRDSALQLAVEGGGLDSVERLVAPIDQVQREWHAHVHRIKAALGGTDEEFRRTGKLPEAE